MNLNRIKCMYVAYEIEKFIGSYEIDYNYLCCSEV